jgi:hypothetical protein
VKKTRSKRGSKAAPKAKKDAWAAAAAYGCDMNLLEISLRMTPEQRIDANQDALDFAEALEAAGKRRHVKA